MDRQKLAVWGVGALAVLVLIFGLIEAKRPIILTLDGVAQDVAKRAGGAFHDIIEVFSAGVKNGDLVYTYKTISFDDGENYAYYKNASSRDQYVSVENLFTTATSSAANAKQIASTTQRIISGTSTDAVINFTAVPTPSLIAFLNFLHATDTVYRANGTSTNSMNGTGSTPPGRLLVKPDERVFIAKIQGDYGVTPLTNCGGYGCNATSTNGYGVKATLKVEWYE